MDLHSLVERARGATRPMLEVAPDPGSIASLAMLSGSFDPITIGHEALARAGATRAGVVALVYSVRTLPKELGAPPPLLEEAARLDALARFSAARPGHVVGLASHGLLSEQVDAAADRFPGATLWLVMGSDKLLQVLDPRWYRDRDESLNHLFRTAHVLYADRAGEEDQVEEVLGRPENAAWRDSIERVAVPPGVVAVSSRRVRTLLSRGERVDRLVPREALGGLPGSGVRPS